MSSNLPFCKLGNRTMNLPLKMEKINNQYGVIVDGQFIGIRYYHVDESIEKKLLKNSSIPRLENIFICH